MMNLIVKIKSFFGLSEKALNYSERPWDVPLESKSRLCKNPKEDWICVKRGSKDRVDALVCKSLDKVLKLEANRLDKEGVENAILKFKKVFHIVEWQDGELTSYKNLSEVVSKGSKPWLKPGTLTLVKYVLEKPQFKNKDEINIQDFVDQIFNPIIDILESKSVE